MIWRAPISAQSVCDRANSTAGNVGDTAVTATARAPSTSCPTFRTSVLSTPPEKATSMEPMSPKIVLRRSSARASVPTSFRGGDDIGINLGFGQFGDDDQVRRRAPGLYVPSERTRHDIRFKDAATLVGQPLLVADPAHESRAEPAAAEDVVHHRHGVEIRVPPVNAHVPQDEGRLREVL